MTGMRCLTHFQTATRRCVLCGAALCPDCSGADLERPTCLSCRQRAHDMRALSVEGGEARAVLRRAGIRVSRRPGDPVVLRQGGPAVAVAVAVTAILLGVAGGLAAAAAESAWRVGQAVTIVGVALAVGASVRFLFGGSSRPAGVFAAVLAALAAALGHTLAGEGWATGELFVGSQHVPGPSEMVLGLTGGCYLLAVLIAFRLGAGRPLS